MKLSSLENIEKIKYNHIKTFVKEFMSVNSLKYQEKEYLDIVDTLNYDKRKNVNALGNMMKKHIESYKKEVSRVQELYDFDKSYGVNIVAGVDEVGRGPLAGPIVSAAVVLDLNSVDPILYINDSKKINSELREKLSEIIKEKAISFSISLLSNEEIDKRGIGYCNNEVFRMAISDLKVKPELVLTDGYPIKNFSLRNEFVIKGDTKSASIACASILAKVYRDKVMKELATIYPDYGFENNVGYGSKEHISAIINHGVTDIHRKSFLTNILEKG
ncbi:ribonuclease HII [Clostridium sp.]|uniref:ribonuclease HII n=1 Tax=Clostridium sp. TaxID=1506 RepID=UPI002FCC3330